MRLNLKLIRGGSEPLHVQIAEGIRSKILDGELKPGQRLPPVRDLALQHGVHRLTAYKAYEELGQSDLIETRVGNGTFVSTSFRREIAADVLARLEGRGPANRFEVVSEEAGLRSLATNVPDPWLFRSDEFLLECYELRKASPWVFYYAPPGGAAELCDAIARQLTQRGLPTEASQIVVTNGNSHSLALVLGLLRAHAAPIAIEDPMFIGAGAWLRDRDYQYEPIARTEDGFDLVELDLILEREQCRCFLTAPSFGHIAGWSLPVEQRKELVEIARLRNCTLIESASTSLITYEEEPKPLLAQFARNEEVILIDDFSSSLSPGLRIGYIRTSQARASALEARLQSDQHSGVLFLQIALANYIDKGHLQAHLERVLPKYRSRRDRMMSALRYQMPEEVNWTYPLGGFSTWVTLPEAGRFDDLYQAALDKGVAVAPGNLFTDPPEARNHIRLSFGTQEPASIEEAIRTLAGLIADRM